MRESINFIVIVIDSARARNFSCYGYDKETTPTIDAIAQEGVLFRRTYAESTWSLPQAHTLLTGLAPREHEAELHKVLPDTVTTLPQLLQQCGYTTVGFSANEFFGPGTGLTKGFDEFFMPKKVISRPYRYVRYLLRGIGGSDLGGGELVRAFRHKFSSFGEPWFALVWFNDLHNPYIAPGRYSRLLCEMEITRLDMLRLFLGMFNSCWNLAGAGSEVDFEMIRGLYDSALRYVDALVAQIIDVLRKAGSWDQTAIIVTADHGEMLGERKPPSNRRLFGHGPLNQTHQELIHIPLVIRLPDETMKGQRTDGIVQLADITHSIAQAVGVREGLPQTAADTVDLFDERARQRSRCWAISERKRISESALQQFVQRNPAFEYGPDLCDISALIKGDWKLVWRSTGDHEMLHILADEKETLTQGELEQREHMLNIIREWHCRARRISRDQQGHNTMPTDIRERLKGMGYF